MARVRTSLKERGQEILGLKRRERAERALLNAWSKMGLRPPGGTGKSMVESASPASARAISHLSFKDLDPDIERRIEALLDAEAAAAVGGDEPNGGDADRLSDESDSRLPSVEWISPVSPTMPRPAPAPPPFVTDKKPAAIPPAPIESGEDSQQEEAPFQHHPEPAVSPQRPKPMESAPPAPVPGIDNHPAVDAPVPPTATEHVALLERADVQRCLTALENSIRIQYDRVASAGVYGSQEITDWCHSLLAEARTIVTHRQLGDLARAEWNVEQVRARLDRAEASDREWRWPALITLWGIAWFVGLLYLIFYPTALLSGLSEQTAVSASILPWVFVQALLFGGVGSVAALFYHLFKYVRDRSFDIEHVLSYFGKPFLGMILGCLVYLSFFVAVRLFGLVSPVEILGATPGTVSNIIYTAPMLFVALVVGFKENLVFNTLSRVIGAGSSK